MGERTKWPGYVYLFVVYIFLFFPALLVVAFSFNQSRFWAFPFTGLTWRWYIELVNRPQAIEAVQNSIIVAVATMVLAVTIGGGVAIALHRSRFRLKGTFESSLLLPQLVPALIWSIALLVFLSYLGVRRGAATIIIGHTLFTAPYVLLLVNARLHSFDPNLEAAARGLGASAFRFFREIMLPHIAPGLLAGGLIAFAISFSDLVIAIFLTGSGFGTLPIYIYSLIQFEPSPVINAVASLIFLTAVGVMLAALLIGGRDVIIPSTTKAP